MSTENTYKKTVHKLAVSRAKYRILVREKRHKTQYGKTLYNTIIKIDNQLKDVHRSIGVGTKGGGKYPISLKGIRPFQLIFMSTTWETLFNLVYIWYIKKYLKIYTHIEYLPLENFSEILKGHYEYLFVGKKRRVPRLYFQRIFAKMNYQFKALDNEHTRDKADLADYLSKYVRTDSKRWLNEYNTLRRKISEYKSEPFNLDEFTDYIEQTFNHVPGSINAKTISTAKAFANYQKAIAHNKQLRAANNKLNKK